MPAVIVVLLILRPRRQQKDFQNAQHRHDSDGALIIIHKSHSRVIVRSNYCLSAPPSPQCLNNYGASTNNALYLELEWYYYWCNVKPQYVSRSRQILESIFLLPISSRQIDKSISIADFFPLQKYPTIAMHGRCRRGSNTKQSQPPTTTSYTVLAVIAPSSSFLYTPITA